MKILLVYANWLKISSPPPVGLTYLIPPLKEQGHEIKILDLMFSKNPHQDLRTTIENFHPFLTGFSIRNLDNHNMMNPSNSFAVIKELVTIARENGTVTVLGGPAFTTFPGEMLRFFEADYGIAGQGEKGFPLLVTAIEDQTGKTKIPGLVFKQGEKVIINPPLISGYPGQKTDWSLINLKPYRKALLPAATVITKSGCPYQCTFCNLRTTTGNKFIFRDINRVIEDIKEIKKIHKTRWFYLNGTIFNDPLDQAKGVVKEDYRLKFENTFYRPPLSNTYLYDEIL